MKNFFLCCIIFLCSAFSSPHNGGTLSKSRDTLLQQTNMYSDSPVVIPLSMYTTMVANTTLRTKDTTIFGGYKQSISSTEYYRNFYAYRHRKPTFVPIVRNVPQFYWCYAV